MSVEAASHQRRNPHRTPFTRLYETPITPFPSQEMPLSKTSLDEDKYLAEYIDEAKLLFKDKDKFRKGAEFCHATLASIGSENFPQEVSEKVVQQFKDYISHDHERNQKLGYYSDYYVQRRPEGRGFTIVRNDKGPGERLFSSNLHFNSQTDPELTLMFRQFEDPATRFGIFTVLTLKELEARYQKNHEITFENDQSTSNIIELEPSESMYIYDAS